MARKINVLSVQNVNPGNIKKGRKVVLTKHLDRILELAPLGYTHESFVEIGRLVRDVSHNLDLVDLKKLEASCRDLYIDDLVSLESVVNELKTKFQVRDDKQDRTS